MWIAYIYLTLFFFTCIKSVIESELALLREKNARLMTKITELEFEKIKLIKRVMKLEEKQLKNIIIKNLLHASQVS